MNTFTLIKTVVLFFFSTVVFGQSLTNDGASIMLQEQAVMFSQDSFSNQNGGKIQGNGTMDFALAMNIGILNPGVIIGNLSIASSMENTATSEIMMDINGNTGIGFLDGNDHIFVDGDLTLNGKLSIASPDGFTPSQQDEFVLVTYTGSLSGTFSNTELPIEFAGFEAVYDTPGQIILKYTGPLSVEDEILETLFVYPNPATDYVHIKYAQKIDVVIMYDMLGKQVAIAERTEKIDVRHLSKGMYLMRIESDGKVQTKKIAIK
jgi:hypothetical protein